MQRKGNDYCTSVVEESAWFPTIQIRKCSNECPIVCKLKQSK